MDDDAIVLSRIRRVKDAISDIEAALTSATEPEELLAILPYLDACTERMKIVIDAALEMTALQVQELELSRDRLTAAQFRYRFLTAQTRDL